MNTNYKFALARIKKEYVEQEKVKPFSKYIVLYRAIKQCVLKNELPYNWLLPSTRVLAQELNLSRTTNCIFTIVWGHLNSSHGLSPQP